jgi:hypothetical protein
MSPTTNEIIKQNKLPESRVQIYEKMTIYFPAKTGEWHLCKNRIYYFLPKLTNDILNTARYKTRQLDEIP